MIRGAGLKDVKESDQRIRECLGIQHAALKQTRMFISLQREYDHSDEVRGSVKLPLDGDLRFCIFPNKLRSNWGRGI